MTARLAGWFPALAIANLLANIGIVVTGGVVRLTGSGLGCPTWPRCTEQSYVPHGELGVHGAIEFGNRMLTWVLVAVALGCLLCAWAARREHGDRRGFLLALVVVLGVPAQGVIGGITVLTDLNPFVVALHLLVSMAIIGVCVWLVDHLRGPTRPAADPHVVRLARLVLAAGWVVLWLGTVVTGSGPHSGDTDSRRTGWDPQVLSHVHALAVYALVALTVGLLVVAHRGGSAVLARTAGVLLGLELLQGVIGWVQYLTDLPVTLVALHMLGAALISAGLARVVVAAHARPAAPAQRSSGSMATATNSSDR